MKLIELNSILPSNAKAEDRFSESIIFGNFLMNFFKINKDIDLFSVKKITFDGVPMYEPVELNIFVEIFQKIYLNKDWMVIKSKSSCRFLYFSHDYRVFLCVKHSDNLQSVFDSEKFVISDCSEMLICTDIFDGF